jgi:hypothetical protein
MGHVDLTVDRWRRYGKDRLYVSREGQTKIGWWDLATDEGHPETPTDAQALAEAVAAWRAGQAPDIAVASPTPPTPGTTSRPWLDLATNQPGAEARERAIAERDAAPIKSLLARAIGVHTDERAWRLGADGEGKVAERLRKLLRRDPRWRVLHAIPVGKRGSDIDHLVIGPGGVFSLNAKHHPHAKIWVGGETLMVDGHKQPYIRNSRHEAACAAKLLTQACGFPVYVEGVIVPVNAKDVVVKAPPREVHVVPRMQLTHWLTRHGEVHPVSTVDAIFEAARRSTTWRD